MSAAIVENEAGAKVRPARAVLPRWTPQRGLLASAWVLARREMRDLVGDWRILVPTIMLAVIFPLLMVAVTMQGSEMLTGRGANIGLQSIVPFGLMLVGFFPISFSLMVALESFAGEKERNSLEALLASPMSDAALYLGKIISALVPPLLASYISMALYLSGSIFVGGYNPDWSLLGSLLMINFSAALVMVSSAVLVSSHTTSVRAANLLASFIILPMSVLIQINNLLVIWGAARIMWLVALGIGAIGLLLLRGGMSLFSRELLLAREMDDLRPRQLWQSFKSFLSLPPRAAIALRSEGRNPLSERFSLRRLYRHDIPVLIRLRAPELGIVVLSLLVAFLIGWGLSEVADSRSIVWSQAISSDPTMPGVGAMAGGAGMSFLDSFAPTLLRLVLLGLFLAMLALISFGLLPVLLMMGVAGGVGFVLGVLSHTGGGVVTIIALLSPPVLLPALAFCLFTAFALRIGLAIGSPPKGFGLGDSLLLSIAEFVKISALAIPMLALGVFMQSLLLTLF